MQQYKEIESAVIFGSHAMECHKPGSDVDLAIKRASINFNTILNISDSLNEESNMPYRFDIIDYQTIHHTSLKDHFDRIGKVIYQQDARSEVLGK